MSERLRIVVTGLAATYPYGGVFWDYLQYPLGLQRLGHDVLYLEDTGRWCYDPLRETFVPDGTSNAAVLRRWISALEPALADRWSFRDARGQVFGRPWQEVAAFCRSADLFLHVSGSCRMRDEYWSAQRVVFIDTDPMYSQASVPDYVAGTADAAARARVDELRRHDAFLTFGENVGRQDCAIPTALFDWQPTRQPIVLDRWTGAAVPVARRRATITTVASWEPTVRTDLIVEGIAYGTKGTELERMLGLPAHSRLPIELAMSGHYSKRRLRAHGWRLTEPRAVSGSPWAYRRYLARSFAEWSVAKSAYVAARTGWFSCRTASYLALGVPAVVQDTGFAGILPTGEGLFTFCTVDEAAGAIERVASDPERHARAAREIVAAYFDSSSVLETLIERCSASRPAPRPEGPVVSCAS